MSTNERILNASLNTLVFMLVEPYRIENPVILRGRDDVSHPWDHIHLSKAERKGKTYEQIQALREQKFREQEDRREFQEYIQQDAFGI